MLPWGSLSISQIAIKQYPHPRANLDFLGRELDPSVLRTYVLVGFLFSYFGLEVLLSGRLSGSTSSPKPLEQVALKPGNRKTSDLLTVWAQLQRVASTDHAGFPKGHFAFPKCLASLLGFEHFKGMRVSDVFAMVCWEAPLRYTYPVLRKTLLWPWYAGSGRRGNTLSARLHTLPDYS